MQAKMVNDENQQVTVAHGKKLVEESAKKLAEQHQITQTSKEQLEREIDIRNKVELEVQKVKLHLGNIFRCGNSTKRQQLL